VIGYSAKTTPFAGPAMPYDALLFDLDGTLIDTETVAMATGMAAFAALGHPVNHPFMQRLVGVDLPSAAVIISAAHPTLNQDELQHHWHRAFAAEIDRGLPLKPGALELLSARHRPMALVTSSGHDEAHHKLRLTGLHLYFDAVVTLADVTSPKPAPQPYLLAAERLGVSPTRCLAFEDSETGAEAAHRAGCTVVQVPDVGQATGRWAHHLARDLIDGAARAGLTAPAL
jgi:HAD superfamily hydrolase (TIGR01509 family)